MDAQFVNIGEGTYLLQAISAGGCSTVAQIEMIEPDQLNVEVTTFYDESTGQGTIAVSTVSGGTPPYTIFWPSQPQAVDSLSGISLGTYVVQITDAAGCAQEFELVLTTAIQSVDVPQLLCYPQPASEFVTVQCAEHFKWKLFDARGDELQNSSYFHPQHRIELREYPAGIYLLSTTAKSGRTQSITLVKQ